MPAKLLENRNGVFIDVTKEMGISIPEQTSGATVGDFNNDGFLDIFRSLKNDRSSFDYLSSIVVTIAMKFI